MSFSIHPATLPPQIFTSPTMASPEERVSQVEQEAYDNIENVPEAQRAAYRTMVRNIIGQIRSTVAEMRALGRIEYEINRKMDGLFQNFHSSSASFFEKGTQYAHAKSMVNQSNDSVGTKISQAVLKSRKISFVPYVEDESVAHSSSIDLEQRKTELAQCVQHFMDPESPYGAMPCLAHHSRGLTETQKKEISDFESDVVLGKNINEVAAGTIMISRAVHATISAVSSVAKTLALGMASETWLETDPSNYNERMKESQQLLGGENAEFNAALKRTRDAALAGVGFVAKAFAIGVASETWMEMDPFNHNERTRESRQLINGENKEFNAAVQRMSAARAAAIMRMEPHLDRLDERAQHRYRTIPGIVKRGILSGAELTAVIAPVPLFRGTAILIRSSLKGVRATAQAVNRSFAPNPLLIGTRKVNGTTSLSPADLAITSAQLKLADPMKGVRGWMEVKEDTLLVNIDMGYLLHEKLTPSLNAIANLERIARVNKVKALEVKMLIRSQSLSNAMLARYGKYLVEEATPSRVSKSFRIPVEQFASLRRLSVSNFFKDEAGTLNLMPILSEQQKTIRKIFDTATEAPKVTNVVHTGLNVHAVMDGNIIRDYGNFTSESIALLAQFAQDSLPLNGKGFYLTKLEHSFSGNRVFSVLSKDGTPLGVVKEVVATRSPTLGFIPEIVSLEHLQGLKYSSVPEILAVGKYTVVGQGERGLLMYEFVPGNDLYRMLKQGQSIPARDVGRALAEINGITAHAPVSEAYLVIRAQIMSNIARTVLPQLENYGIKPRFTIREVEQVAQDALRNPGHSGVVHGDPHLGNFIYDAPKLTIIDSGALIEGINHAGIPHGSPSFDRFWLIRTVQDFGNDHKIPTSTINSIVKEFELGYREVFPLPVSVEADRFAELFYDLYSLDSYPQIASARSIIGEIVEKIDLQLAPPRVAHPTLKITLPKPEKTIAAKIYNPVRRERVVSFLNDEAGTVQLPTNEKISTVARVISKTFLPIKAPDSLPAFAQAIRVKSKANVRGGGVARRRWLDKKHIYEWDSRHGYVEKFDLRGKHQGKFDAQTGVQVGPINPRKITTP